MSSKSNPQEIHSSRSEQDQSKSWSPPPPPPPSRPVRIKTVPNRFHYGVDRSIRGFHSDIPSTDSPLSKSKKGPTEQSPKPKGVSFKEPAKTVPKKRKAPEGKGKAKMSESSKPIRRKRATASKSSGQSSQPVKKAKNAPPSVSTDSEQEQSSSKSSSSATQPSQESESPPIWANAIEDIYNHSDPPKGFTTTNTFLSEAQNAKFKEQYMKRDFCPVVAVNLAQLQQECNVNLSPWLIPYNSFISISAPYTPNLVRLFYFNMVSDNILDIDGELVEERMTTIVRSVKFTLSASIINTILKIENPPTISTPEYSNREIFSVLRPNEEFPKNQSHTLSFKPGSMPPLHRVLWYIYSRNFVQKGGSFTHFSQKDYRFFTAFVKKHPINLGHWIYQEMVKFKFSSRKASYFPFPSLISVILFYHKIWFVGPPEVMKSPPLFGKAQLNLMKLNFEAEGSGHSHAPSRSQARASQSRAQEAQSTPPPQSSLPSDFDERVKAIVDAAIAALSIRLEFEIGKLVAEVQRGNNESVDAQDALKDQLVNIDAKLSTQMVTNGIISDKVERILKHLNLGSSTGPSTRPESEPSSSSPSFTFNSPQIPTSSPKPTSTPTTEVLSSPSPITPATQILDPSLTPTTEVLHLSPPSTPLFDPLQEPSTSAPFAFEDDKGGEKDNA